MATILNARDLMLQDPTRERFTRPTKVLKVSTYPWLNLFPSPSNPTTFNTTKTASLTILDPEADPAVLFAPNTSNTTHGVSRQEFIATAAVGVHEIQQAFYVKDDGTGTYHIRHNLSARNSDGSISVDNTYRFNPVTADIIVVDAESTTDVSWTSSAIKVSQVSGGWWKVVVKVTLTIINPGVDKISCYFGVVKNDGTQTYIGDGVAGVYFYGPQAYSSFVDELIGDTYVDLESDSVFRWNGHSWDTTYTNSKTYKQETEPSSPSEGDIWLKTNGSGVIIEVYQYTNGIWEFYPNSVTGMLTKESATIAADSGGTVTGSYSTVGGSFKVYAGSVDVSTAGSVVYSIQTEAFVNATIDTATGVYTMATLTGDVGTVILRAVYTAATGVTTTIDKTYTLSKVKDGADGLDGLDGGVGPAGINSATVYLYKRSATTVVTPSADSTYTFATKTLVFDGGIDDGWDTEISSGADPLWVTAAVASSNTATAVIDGSDGTDGSDWSTAAKLTENGLNSATVNLYIRTSTEIAPAVPASDVIYTFATGAITPSSPDSWTTTSPSSSQGKYLWAISAAAISPYTTDTINTGNWSAPTLVMANGAFGYTLIPSTNVTIVNGSGLKKTGGTSGWNEQGYSLEGFYGGASVSAQFVNSTTAVAFGLDTSPSGSATKDSIEYSWVSTSSGFVSANISGTQVYPATGTVALSTSNVYSIIYDNTATRFLINGSVVYAIYNDTPDQTLYFDSSFFHVNGEIKNIVFSPVGSSAAPSILLRCSAQSFTYSGENVAEPTTQDIVLRAYPKNLVGEATFVYRLYDTAGVAVGTATTLSSTANTATLTVSVFNAAPTAKYGVITASLSGLSDTETIAKLVNGSNALTVDLTNAAHTIASYANGYVPDYTGASTRVTVWKGATDVSAEAWTWTPTSSDAGLIATMGVGVDKNLLTVTSMADSLDSGYVDIAVSRVGYVTQNKRFTIAKSKGGNPNFNLVTNVGTAKVIYPNTITKPTGSVSWDSDCYTLESYVGGAFCSAQILTAGEIGMFGLNSDPLTDGSFTSLNYAWHTKSDNTANVRLNGTEQTSVGAITTATILSIIYDNKNVVWLKDGIAVYTVSAPGLSSPLYFDSSLNSIGSGYRNIAFGPAGSAGISSVTASLSKDSVSLQASLDGVVTDFSQATTTMTILVGEIDESASWTYTTTASGCTIGSGNNTRSPTLSAMSSDAASITLVASKSGSIYPNQTKVFTLTKNRGNIGIVPSRATINAEKLVIDTSPPGTCTSTVSVLSDGRISYSYYTGTRYQNWYMPTTSGLTSYWVRMTKINGATISGPASGTWSQLSSSRTWSISFTGTNGSAIATIDIDIAESSGGEIVSTGRIYLMAEVSDLS